MVNDEFVWEGYKESPYSIFLREVMGIGKFEKIYLNIAEMAFEQYQKEPNKFNPNNWKLRCGYDSPNYIKCTPSFILMVNFE